MHIRALALVVLGSFASAAPAASSSPSPSPHWVASWAASPQPARRPMRLGSATVRQIVHLSLGGPRVRVRLSNVYGTTPLRIGAAHLAVHARGAAIVAGSDRALSFAGAPSALIPAGAQLESDPVALPAPAGGELVVSLYLPDAMVTTEHATALETTYVADGDRTAAADLAGARTTSSWYFLAGVDVDAPAAARAIVALGDSITDGMGATRDANRRWPDALAARLNARATGAPRAVVDAGISGNGLVLAIVGEPVVTRVERDALAQPGVAWIVLLIGVNDITPEKGAPAPLGELVAADRQLIARAHARGVKVMGATLIPFGAEGPADASYEAERQALNQWIRTSGAFDAVVDFDRALRDPARPTHLPAAFDSGDHTHPNDAGYRAMADAIDLSRF